MAAPRFVWDEDMEFYVAMLVCVCVRDAVCLLLFRGTSKYE